MTLHNQNWLDERVRHLEGTIEDNHEIVDKIAEKLETDNSDYGLEAWLLRRVASQLRMALYGDVVAVPAPPAPPSAAEPAADKLDP